MRVRMQGSAPLQGTFVINELFIGNCCAKIHLNFSSSVLSNSEVLVKKLSSFLFVWHHLLCSSYFFYPLFDLMLCYLPCSFALLFRLVYYNHNYNIWAVKCKLTRLLKLLFLIKNTQYNNFSIFSSYFLLHTSYIFCFPELLKTELPVLW